MKRKINQGKVSLNKPKEAKIIKESVNGSPHTLDSTELRDNKLLNDLCGAGQQVELCRYNLRKRCASNNNKSTVGKLKNFNIDTKGKSKGIDSTSRSLSNIKVKSVLGNENETCTKFELDVRLTSISSYRDKHKINNAKHHKIALEGKEEKCTRKVNVKNISSLIRKEEELESFKENSFNSLDKSKNSSIIRSEKKIQMKKQTTSKKTNNSDKTNLKKSSAIVDPAKSYLKSNLRDGRRITSNQSKKVVKCNNSISDHKNKTSNFLYDSSDKEIDSLKMSEEKIGCRRSKRLKDRDKLVNEKLHCNHITEEDIVNDSHQRGKPLMSKVKKEECETRMNTRSRALKTASVSKHLSRKCESFCSELDVNSTLQSNSSDCAIEQCMRSLLRSSLPRMSGRITPTTAIFHSFRSSATGRSSLSGFSDNSFVEVILKAGKNRNLIKRMSKQTKLINEEKKLVKKSQDVNSVLQKIFGSVISKKYCSPPKIVKRIFRNRDKEDFDDSLEADESSKDDDSISVLI